MKNKSTTIVDIADELGIDSSTVSRALKDHPKISDRTKRKVLRTAKKLNYQPNGIATALVKGSSKLIGVMVPFTDENFFASVIRGIEEVAKKEGYRIVIFQSNDKKEEEIQNIQAMLAAKVDGILASHAMETKDFEHFQKIIDNNIPLTLFDRYHESVDADLVAINDFQAAYHAVEHLIDQGCRKISHFTGSQDVHIYKERLRGYKQALQDNNLTLEQNQIFETDMTLQGGQNATTKMLQTTSEIDAIFASNDYTAMGAIQILKKNNITIPEEIAIVGFSNEAFTSFVTPPITTVDQHSREMGELAAKSCLDQLSNQSKKTSQVTNKKILKAELIVRASSLKKQK